MTQTAIPTDPVEAFLPELFELLEEHAHHSLFFGPDFDFDALAYDAAWTLERGDGLDAALKHLEGTDAHPAAAPARMMLAARAASPGAAQA